MIQKLSFSALGIALFATSLSESTAAVTAQLSDSTESVESAQPAQHIHPTADLDLDQFSEVPS